MDKLAGVRRKLTLMRAKQDFELGRITRAKYNEILDSCNNTPLSVREEPAAFRTRTDSQEQTTSSTTPAQADVSAVGILDETYLQSLHTQRAEILRKKADLSNSLRHVPRDKSAKHLTDAILKLRNDFSRVQETIRQYMSTGLKPEQLQQQSIAASIPSDKYTLDKDIKATKKRLKYAEDALRTAKDPGIRMRHEINLSQDTMRLDLLLTKFRNED